MVSRRALALPDGCFRLIAKRPQPAIAPVCPFCSLVPSCAAQPRYARSRRFQSTATPSPSPVTANTRSTSSGDLDPRAQLQRALVELQRRNPALLDPHRVQLALQGLRQQPGQEAVRVAILGLNHGSDRKDTARKVLKALLADPLTEEQEWERALDEHDTRKPLVVRVGRGAGGHGARLEVSREGQPRELGVSSAELNGSNLELLLMNVAPPTTVEELLVPAVEIQSADNRSTLLATPVHQALLVADGLKGALHISALGGDDLTMRAVDLKGFSGGELEADIAVVDTSLAGQSIELFRKGPQYAMDYERCWSASNLATLTAWLKAGVKTKDDETRPAVQKLIASLLQRALSDIDAESESAKEDISGAQSTRTAPPEVQALSTSLDQWAQQAHAELQGQLDLAFTGLRWRKLRWWKLFWRVDDVAMITNELLSQRFLPTAEQELVYLTGRIAQLQGKAGRYAQPKSKSALPRWPGHIAFTRRYLQNETVPALQSLAQRLVIESLATSSLTSILAGLLYVSSFSSSVFEAGAVAALGAVYSLGRMQKRWDAARDFWEGEVREEGRKAVRAAEESVAGELYPAKGGISARRLGELEEARGLVTRARDALARLR